MTDLDGNESNEAVAFFRNSAETSSVHMLVMYSKDNSWKIASDNIFETTDIDSVDFADLTGNGKAEIIVNSTTYTPNVGKLSFYSYSDGKTSDIGSGQSCSSFVTGDFDGDGDEDIAVYVPKRGDPYIMILDGITLSPISDNIPVRSFMGNTGADMAGKSVSYTHLTLPTNREV